MEIPGYTLLSELGKGGMATVYLARQESLNREVALKVMSPALATDSTFTERFIKEGQTIARFSHPHIITIYDIGLAGHHHYIAMEYVGDKNLKDRLHDFCAQAGATEAIRAQCLDKILVVVRQVAMALGYAHQKGFVHRDVKPENILFRDDGTAILTDFGIAKAVNSCTQLTNTGVSIGTPRYMSPEQARGRAITPASDLYALGIVLFELLSGHPPFSGPDTLTILYSHVNDPIPSLPAPHFELQALINKLLAKQAEDRYATAKALIEVLDYYQMHRSLPVSLLATAPSTAKTEGVPTDPYAATIVQPSSEEVQAALSKGQLGKKAKWRPWLRWGGLGFGLVAMAGLVFALWPAATPPPSPNPVPLAQAPPIAPSAHFERWLALALAHFQAGQYTQPPEQNAAFYYRKILHEEPSHPQALAGLEQIAEYYWQQAQTFQRQGNIVDAAVQVEFGLRIAPQHGRLLALKQALRTPQKGNDLVVLAEKNPLPTVNDPVVLAEKNPPPTNNDPVARVSKNPIAQVEKVPAFPLEDDLAAYTKKPATIPIEKVPEIRVGKSQAAPTQPNIQQMLARAEKQLKANRLSRPKGNNALASYEAVLRLDPGNKEAQQGKRRIAERYGRLAKKKMRNGQTAKARQYVERGLTLAPKHPQLRALQQKLEAPAAASTAVQPYRRPGKRRHTGPTKNPGKAGSSEYKRGENFYYGTGVRKNYRQAVEWYRKAAKSGNAKAQMSLGACYANGRGVSKNNKEALYWLHRAAKSGEPQAQYLFGLGSLVGQPRHAKTAAIWLEKAARRGYRRAYRVIGWMYEKGIGVNASLKNSVRWNAKAMFKSIPRGNGKGVPAWEQRFSSISGK